jgi:hypothetical protein
MASLTFYGIQRIGSEVIDEGSVGDHLVDVNSQLFDDEIADPGCDF